MGTQTKRLDVLIDSTSLRWRYSHVLVFGMSGMNSTLHAGSDSATNLAETTVMGNATADQESEESTE